MTIYQDLCQIWLYKHYKYIALQHLNPLLQGLMRVISISGLTNGFLVDCHSVSTPLNSHQSCCSHLFLNAHVSMCGTHSFHRVARECIGQAVFLTGLESDDVLVR